MNEQQKDALKKLVTLFKEWNEKINLSSFNDEKTINIKHCADSLLPINAKEFQNAKTILDLGTGGGFPGIPLAIMFPKKSFTLVDSVQKKIEAVKDMAQSLNLKNVKTISERIEIMGQDKKYREQFDMVTARALAKFPTMLEYCLPCVKIGGTLVAYQGQEIYEYLKDSRKIITLLGGKLKRTEEYELPEKQGKRLVVFILKISSTPKQYPRAIGIPKKSPL